MLKLRMPDAVMAGQFVQDGSPKSMEARFELVEVRLKNGFLGLRKRNPAEMDLFSTTLTTVRAMQVDRG